MGNLEGKVAFISGVARGQGRSHAVRLAQEGVDIIGFDVCEQIPTVAYPLSTPEDLAETVRLVEKEGRRMVARKADVRDFDALQTVLDDGMNEFGRVDIILANAGAMFGWGLKDRSPELTRQAWKDSIDVMLTGAFNTVHVALPAMIEGGNGGSIVLTSSTAGLKTMVGPSATAEAAATGIGYAAAKNGLAGLMKVWAGAMGHHGIRVNSVLPTGVNTPFLVNDVMQQAMLDNPGMAASWRNALPVELIEAVDISNAIAWLCSDAARYVTGVQLPVDAGFLIL